jgi:hypothetical protein
VARYVRDGEVFEIEQQGPVLEISEGGTKTTRKFVSAEHAAVQLRRLVDQRLGAGFVEAGASPAESDAWPSPDDLEAVAIHADRLMADGDARGPFVALQLAHHALAGQVGADAEARRAELVEEGEALLVANRALFFGELGPAVSARFAGATSSRGSRPTPASIPAFERGATQPIRLELRLGQVERARLVATARLGIGAVYRALRALPNAQHLRALAVGPTVTRDKRAGFHYQDLYDALEGAPLPATLSELAIGDVTPELVPAANPGDVSGVLTQAPGLRGLSVSGRHVELRPVELPLLETLCLHTTVHPSLLATLGRSTLPALERLSLVSFGIGAVLPEALDFVEHRARGVRDLTLRGFGGGVDRADVFDRGLFRSLARLDLAENGLGEELGEWVLEHAPQFEHLEHLDLRRNQLSHGLARALRAALPHAEVLDQGGPIPVDRYEGIRE